jgi:5'(3')-deoxyribonucleotidase
MNKAIIAVDCDDVLVATAQQILDQYNRVHGTSVSDYTEIWQLMSSDETRDNRNTYLDSEEYMQSQPIQDAMRALRELNERFELHIVTGRPGFMQDITLAWLKKHLPEVFKTVVFTDFFKQQGGRSKADICLELGADYLIDDHIRHCEAVARVGVTALLFGDYTWNQADELPKGVIRCKDWPAVAEYFDGIGQS